MRRGTCPIELHVALLYCVLSRNVCLLVDRSGLAETRHFAPSLISSRWVHLHPAVSLATLGLVYFQKFLQNGHRSIFVCI